MGSGSVVHGLEHHEPEYSAWPLVVGISALIIPFAFMAAFQWKLPVMGMLLCGAGVVGILLGLFGWVSEIYAKKADVGLSKVAILLFIVSEFILFGGLFGSYFYTMFPAEIWPPANTPAGVPPLGLALILSVFLLSSSATIHVAEAKLDKGNTGGFVGWLFFTMILGTLFLLGQANEWGKLISEGFTIGSNAYGRYFFLITGVHGSHVLVGVVLQLFVMLTALRKRITPEKQTIVKACGYYWHFVDGIWLLVLSLVYVIPYKF